MMVYTCNPGGKEVETGDFLGLDERPSFNKRDGGLRSPGLYSYSFSLPASPPVKKKKGGAHDKNNQPKLGPLHFAEGQRGLVGTFVSLKVI